MKILRVIILMALVLSFMPLDAFCDDHHVELEHHHGVVVCHSSCHHGAVLIDIQPLILPEITTSLFLAQDFSYDEPILPTNFRPPINFS